MSIKCVLRWALAALMLNLSLAVAAAAGPVVLTVNADDKEARYDIDGLKALGMTDVVTDTPWTDGMITFTGVLMRDLLNDAGVSGDRLRAVALNDYTVEIPVQDFLDFDVILAVQRDGSDLTVRDRGPLWIIYPWADLPRLRTEHYYSRSIWQLKALYMVED